MGQLEVIRSRILAVGECRVLPLSIVEYAFVELEEGSNALAWNIAFLLLSRVQYETNRKQLETIVAIIASSPPHAYDGQQSQVLAF